MFETKEEYRYSATYTIYYIIILMFINENVTINNRKIFEIALSKHYL
jgi:hypothetical protein